MMFMVVHTHDAAKCPGSKGAPAGLEAIRDVVDEARAKKAGMKLLASYGAYTEHVLYFVVETENYGALRDFFDPLMEIGNTVFKPVSSPIKT